MNLPKYPCSYICYRARKPLRIDGKLDDEVWRDASWTEDFVDIEGNRKPRPRFRTRAKMLWDGRYFYIGAELAEPHVWATLTNLRELDWQPSLPRGCEPPVLRATEDGMSPAFGVDSPAASGARLTSDTIRGYGWSNSTNHPSNLVPLW